MYPYVASWLGCALLGLGCAGCISGPPEGQPSEKSPAGPSSAKCPAPTTTGTPAGSIPAAAAAAEPEYRDLPPLHGAKGGTVTIRLDGTPDQVLAMLLDFDNDVPNRPWRKKNRTLPPEGNVRRSEATFEEGLFPVVRVLRHTVGREGDSVVVDYEIEKRKLGLVRFDGRYTLTPVEDGKATQLTETVHIDSGVFIRNATQHEVKEGLLEDARCLWDWMKRRSAK